MQYPLINGHRYDFSSIEGSIAGKKYMGYTSINYKQTLEPGEARGNHAQRYGTTRGQLKADADFEMLKEEGEEFIRGLGDGYMEKRFNMTVVYSEEGGKTRTDVLHNCRIQEVSDGHSEGGDALKLKFTLSVDWVEKDGKKPLKRMLSA